MTVTYETPTMIRTVRFCDGDGCVVKISSLVEDDQPLTDLDRLRTQERLLLRRMAAGSGWRHKPPDTDYCPICVEVRGGKGIK